MNIVKSFFMFFVVAFPAIAAASEQPKPHITRVEARALKGTLVTYSSSDGTSAWHIIGTNIYADNWDRITRIEHANRAYAWAQLNTQWEQQEKARIEQEAAEREVANSLERNRLNPMHTETEK